MSTANRCAPRLLDSSLVVGALLAAASSLHFGLVGFESRPRTTALFVLGSEWRVKAALDKASYRFPPQSSPYILRLWFRVVVPLRLCSMLLVLRHTTLLRTTEKNMMTLYPTMFDGGAPPPPRTVLSFLQNLTLLTRLQVLPHALLTPPETPRKTSLEGVSEEQPVSRVPIS